MASVPIQDPYKVLGVPNDATNASIRSAYRKLVLGCHPDVARDEKLKEERRKKFIKIQQAWEIIGDEKTRSLYDDQLKLTISARRDEHDHVSARRSAYISTLEERVPTELSRKHKSLEAYLERRSLSRTAKQGSSGRDRSRTERTVNTTRRERKTKTASEREYTSKNGDFEGATRRGEVRRAKRRAGRHEMERLLSILKVPKSNSPMERTVECHVCLDEVHSHKAVLLDCGHRMCQTCLKFQFKVPANESRVTYPSCCGSQIHVQRVERLLDVQTKTLWMRAMANIEPYSARFEALSKSTRYTHTKSSPSTTTSNPNTSQKNVIYEIPSKISGAGASRLTSQQKVNALGDYCAKYNFMREDYASTSGFTIEKKGAVSVTVGGRNTITSLGTTKASFQFEGEEKSYPLVFHVLPNCIHNVILGRPFLKVTSTFSSLSNFVSRVKERLLQGIAQHHLLYLGDSVPHFLGLLNGKPQEAMADSGAKVLVMDEDWALKNGLFVRRGSAQRTTLQFADGSTALTSGTVHGVEWEFGPIKGGPKHKLDFHILKNAPADIILSDSFLFGTKAFSQYNCYLVEDDDDEVEEDDAAFLFAIDVAKPSHGQGSTSLPSPGNAKHIELVFRGEKEDEIAGLPVNQQAAAWAQEHDRRAEWEKNFAKPTQGQLQPPLGSSLAVNSAASGTITPSSSSNSSNSQGHQASPGLKPDKFSHWRLFKMKKKNSSLP